LGATGLSGAAGASAAACACGGGATTTDGGAEDGGVDVAPKKAPATTARTARPATKGQARFNLCVKPSSLELLMGLVLLKARAGHSVAIRFSIYACNRK
jgi:hypothetical protein